ncbi:MAG: HD domain-containing protein [Prevotellaceae bacterium]|jgi:HD superfamily phosphohydrolase|nr:HD domain-containing protein [Prevotellaceae bacterium]
MNCFTDKKHRNKIINDPVHGFITVSSPFIYSILEHPYVQRLRKIKQLGLTYFVYPGACHNRLQHALGAMYLMDKALNTLKNKGHEITPEETEAALATILLHDIGHGPFSHTLETSIVENINHETVSTVFMKCLNEEFGGALDKTLEIFSKKYPKLFINELVSGQLDVDRLDYLRRDSFFSGVVEGMVGLDRIINMLDVDSEKLVVEAKGIYSIEKFIISRRLMYWQVYLHKTVLSAENVLMQIFRRAKYLTRNGEKLFAPPSLAFFLNNSVNISTLVSGREAIENFACLSDGDIECATNVWISHPDKILSVLCKMLVHRILPRTEIKSTPFSEEIIEEKRKSVQKNLKISFEDTDYFVISKVISNTGYSTDSQSILIKNNDGSLTDIYRASDMLKHLNINGETSKYMLSAPKYR